MIPFEKALELVLDSAWELGSERVEIGEAMGRILGEDVRSDIDIPPFDKSAMDGYACRREELGKELEIVEVIGAGVRPEKRIGEGQCAKIMTGAMVPEGADCVVMVEYTESTGENTMRFTGEKSGDNICGKGENIKAGDVVLHKGVRIGAEHIATMASVGCARPLVSLRCKVGVIATGNELVGPGEKPGVSQIRDSNSWQLCAQVEKVGAIGRNYGIVGDSKAEIDTALKKGLAENDVVVISGGVSAGDYDYVPEVLKEDGAKVLFERIAIKPGKPTVFGIFEKCVCFGLPGNPAAGFVIFELMVKRFIYKMMGCEYKGRDIPMALEETVRRKKTKRQSWIPVVITDEGRAQAVEYHGSSHISAFCAADGLICMDIGVGEIEKGTSVRVRLI